MSALQPDPEIDEYLARLSPAQRRHLRLIVNDDQSSTTPSQYNGSMDDEVPADLLALIGSVEGTPGDYATNHDHYLHTRIQQDRD